MTIPESRIWRRKQRGIIFVASKGLQSRRVKAISPALHRRHTSFNSHQDQPHEEYRDEEKQHPEQPPNSQITSDWVITIKDKLDRALQCEASNSWLDNCIFRVPKNLREIHPKAFSPQIVSIGPYHRANPCLKDMEKHKWRFLRHVLDRTGHPLELFLEYMMEVEDKTRQCYAKPMDPINSQGFVETMLLDACFILELLRVSINGIIFCGYSWGDPIFTSRGVLPCIQRDLLMLENQLPFFLLERLFSLTSDPQDENSLSLGELALQFFDPLLTGRHNNQLHKTPNCSDSSEPPLHLLHFVRHSLMPFSSKPKFECIPEMKLERQSQLLTHCVTMLKNSGVKFQKKNSEKFMDIEFKNGLLRMPPIVIHDSTKAIFLNLMAFEQCYPHCSNHVTSYVSFMDGLINCPRDVGELRYRGIIELGLGSEEEVASLFNKLCKEIAFDINDCYLAGVSGEVNRYFDRKWHKWRASLRRDYFSNPWAILSLLAAVLLIGLTTAQTFYAIFDYYVPSS